MKNILQSLVLMLLALLPATAAAHDYEVDGIYYNGNEAAVTSGTSEYTGDVNGDGEVDIADVISIIDIILDGTMYVTAADVNNDGEVDIADVTAVINMILEGHQTDTILGTWYSEYFINDGDRFDILDSDVVGYEFNSDNTGQYCYYYREDLIYIGLRWNLQDQRLYIWYDDGDSENLYCKIDENGYLLLSLDENFNTYTAYRRANP